jgi:hypothetical protein
MTANLIELAAKERFDKIFGIAQTALPIHCVTEKIYCVKKSLKYERINYIFFLCFFQQGVMQGKCKFDNYDWTEFT